MISKQSNTMETQNEMNIEDGFRELENKIKQRQKRKVLQWTALTLIGLIVIVGLVIYFT